MSGSWNDGVHTYRVGLSVSIFRPRLANFIRITDTTSGQVIWEKRISELFRLAYKAGSTTVRSLVAWKKQALIYKARPITNASIRIRADKSDTPQAFYKASHGVSRRYDKGVVRIDCLEAIAKA